MVSTTCLCGTGARSVNPSDCVQMASRLAWQLGQKYRHYRQQRQYRHLHEKANRYSYAQSSQRVCANPCSNTPQARNLSTTYTTTGRHGP